MTDADYKVIWENTAKNDIKKLSRPVAIAIDKKVLNFLAHNPRGSNTKPLSGPYKGLWRYRVADDYHVFYAIDDNTKTITITNIEHRSSAY